MKVIENRKLNLDSNRNYWSNIDFTWEHTAITNTALGTARARTVQKLIQEGGGISPAITPT